MEDPEVSKKTNEPTVAGPIEAHLAEHHSHGTVQPNRAEGSKRGVIRIQQSVDLWPLPADVPGERQIHRRRDRSSRSHGQVARIPSFQEGAGRGSDACRCCEVDQPPATPMSTRANRL